MPLLGTFYPNLASILLFNELQKCELNNYLLKAGLGKVLTPIKSLGCENTSLIWTSKDGGKNISYFVIL